ncbi:MAG TPA: nuclear transport factor 2 family protein [Solirubrobacteraceae bacterium]|jgi:hypothetical protein|nr:nuclear transport factor 2 family protein [Solirubrobacteraceae bacterium]
MSRAGVSEVGAALETARLFIEALNARDVETLRATVTSDVELRTPQGAALRGYDGLEDVVRAALENDLLLVRRGPERVDEESGATRVSVPVRELVRRGELQGTAVFEVRDGRISAFEVVPAT